MDNTLLELQQNQNLLHWELEIEQDNIAILKLDRQNSSVNSLDKEVLAELDQILNLIDSRQNEIRGIIVLSNKPNGFIAGADITQFTQVSSVDEGFELMMQAQRVLAKWVALPMPTVAVIHGFCLGGGLEFALACHYRLAANTDNTILGFPEVNLGLHPGWGGTVRMPRLIKLTQAFKMMLSGVPISAQQALDFGVVDHIFAPSELLTQARHFLLQPKLLTHKIKNKIFCRYSWLRPWVSSYFYHQLQKKIIKAHYPAPYRIIDNWRKQGACSESAFIQEAKSISTLMMTYSSSALIQLFLVRAKMKAIGRHSKHTTSKIHIVGCGALGSSLAICAVQKGFAVTLQDINLEKIDHCLKQLEHILKLKGSTFQSTISLQVAPDPQGERVEEADIIIEAISEDLIAKQELLKILDSKKQANTLILTTTSTLDLKDLSKVLSDPSILVGLHTLSNNSNNEVFEIVAQTITDPSVIIRMAAFINGLGYLPVVVSDTPGYLLLRILMPYLFEAMNLLSENFSISDIENAMSAFGMTMSPFALIDQIGLDVCVTLGKQLPTLRHFPVPTILEHKIALGHLGRKIGKGFYNYGHSHKETINKNHKNPKLSTAMLTSRLVPLLVNAALDAQAEQATTDSTMLDAALVYSGSFAAFRGGPINYLKHYGIMPMKRLLSQLEHQYGQRYRLLSGWDQIK